MTTEQLDIEELVERVRTYALDIIEGRAEADWHGDWYIEFAQAFLHVTAALERAERHRAAASQDAVYFRKRMVKAEAVVEELARAEPFLLPGQRQNMHGGQMAPTTFVAFHPEAWEPVQEALSSYDEPPTGKGTAYGPGQPGWADYAGPPTDRGSPFPQPALESEEKGLWPDREIPGKPADYEPRAVNEISKEEQK